MIATAPPEILGNGLIQLGFAGFSVLLLLFIYRLFVKLVEVIEKNNSILAKLTEAINNSASSITRVEENVKEHGNKINDLTNEVSAMRAIVSGGKS